MLERAKAWARSIRRDVVALWLAGRDRRTPLAARIVAIAVAAYALSPIDLIPDFVPVLGYLDDIVIVPLGILLAVRLIPASLMAELRQRAEALGRLPASRVGAAVVIGLWIAGAGLAGWWAWRAFA